MYLDILIRESFYGGKEMKVKKIFSKIKLDQNVKAEDAYKCNHDCIEYYYSGSNAANGCVQKSEITSKITVRF